MTAIHVPCSRYMPADRCCMFTETHTAERRIPYVDARSFQFPFVRARLDARFRCISHLVCLTFSCASLMRSGATGPVYLVHTGQMGVRYTSDPAATALPVLLVPSTRPQSLSTQPAVTESWSRCQGPSDICGGRRWTS